MHPWPRVRHSLGSAPRHTPLVRAHISGFKGVRLVLAAWLRTQRAVSVYPGTATVSTQFKHVVTGVRVRCTHARKAMPGTRRSRAKRRAAGRDGNPRPNFFLDPSGSRPVSRPGARRLWCIPGAVADGWLGRAWSWVAWAAAWLLLTASAIAHPAAVAIAVVRQIARRHYVRHKMRFQSRVFSLKSGGGARRPEPIGVSSLACQADDVPAQVGRRHARTSKVRRKRQSRSLESQVRAKPASHRNGHRRYCRRNAFHG